LYLDSALFFAKASIRVGQVLNGMDMFGGLEMLLAGLFLLRYSDRVLGCGSHCQLQVMYYVA
jgi:hypothetical protein